MSLFNGEPKCLYRCSFVAGLPRHATGPFEVSLNAFPWTLYLKRDIFMYMKTILSLTFAGLTLCVLPAASQVPLPVNPNWISNDQDFSTGAALVDLNQDGWLDLVVANGNDMAKQHVVVYYNKKDGTFPEIPDWQSADVDYHGHIAVGDVNGDGYPDIAVSVYLGPKGFAEPGYVKVYMNHSGTLESTPSWRSADSAYSFNCAFGDANGDGEPDLAVACGESYDYHPEHDRIYINRGGRLDTLPSWRSAGASYSYDVAWADFGNSGRLDLVFANERGPNVLYKNYGDSIGTVPVWQSTDSSQFGNSLAIADLNKDGYLDLAISDNKQLGGSGHFKVYLNNGGTLSSSPDWSAGFSGQESGITMVDITNDGWPDIIGGGWWEPCRVFINARGTFDQLPAWLSSTGSVVEAIVVGDVDNRGLDTVRVTYMGNGSRKLFKIPRPPVQRLTSVTVGLKTLSGTEYCCSLENGWISLAAAPAVGDVLSLEAVVSHSLDLVVSNWDPTVGNYLFINNNGVTSLAASEERPSAFDLLQNYPNPFNGETAITYSVPARQEQLNAEGKTRLMVFDLSGKEVATLVNRPEPPGEYTVHFDASHLPSGVYFYQLHAGGRVVAKKMVLAK